MCNGNGCTFRGTVKPISENKSSITNPRKPMGIEALAEAVKNTVITTTDIAEIETRLNKAEEEFELESRNRRITQEFLNREYTI